MSMTAQAKEPRTVRPFSAAGLYYPRDAQGLRAALRTLLSTKTESVPRVPKALVVPHAGYAYSGSVAASAYRLLDTPAASAIRHVVLLGPSHRVPMRGMALPSWNYFATPFGEVPVDDEARTRLRELGLAGIADAPHALEHSLEVQLPFLQSVLGYFDVLPLAVGSAPAEQVCRALGAVWGGPETLVVVNRDDILVPPRNGKKLNSGISGSKLVELDGAHAGVIEYPNEHNEAFLQFLGAAVPA